MGADTRRLCLRDVWQDFRFFAARFFAKERGLAFVAVLMLAIGISVNTMMFTVINAMVLRGLPIERPDRVSVAGWNGRISAMLFNTLDAWPVIRRTMWPLSIGLAAGVALRHD